MQDRYAYSCRLSSREQTASLAQSLASAWRNAVNAPMLFSLEGQLGAGKTEWVRSVLHALGHAGPVPSPTYAILIPYGLPGLEFPVLHLDLYRVADPMELEELGIDRDWAASLVFVEWPERGIGHLPQSDVLVRLSIPERRDTGNDERDCMIAAETERGRDLVSALSELCSGVAKAT